MHFDTTHEYYLDDPSLYYCSEHRSLIVHSDEGRTTNRLLLHGVQLDALVELSKKIIEETTKESKTKTKRVTTKTT